MIYIGACPCIAADTFCTDNCNCKNTAANLFQRLNDVHSIYKRDLGWCVVANKDLEQDVPVLQYTGRVCNVSILHAYLT